jgi:hypothetical protein
MLSEEQELLLTAFVDGDVTREERESIECLLRNSSEARSALRAMQENAHRLKKLSKLHLGQRFTSQVLASLPAQPNGAGHESINLTDVGDEPLVRKPRLRRGMPSWAIGAIAASLILAVIGIGSMYLQDRGLDPRLPKDPLIQNSVKNKPKAPTSPQPTENPMDPVIAQLFGGASDGFAQPWTEKARPQAPQPAPPTRFTFADLKQGNHYDYLAWELKKQDSVRLDVHIKNDGREPLNRLIESFHKQGIHLVVTPPAHKSLKENLPVLVYAENVNADKLAEALRELSKEVISGTKKLPSPFERLQMTNGAPKDLVEVARGLGVSVQDLKPSETPASPDHAEGVVFSQQSAPLIPREVQEFLGARRAPLPGTLKVFVQLVPKS